MSKNTDTKDTNTLEGTTTEELIAALKHRGCTVIEKEGILFTPGHNDGTGPFPGLRVPETNSLTHETEAQAALGQGYKMREKVKYFTIILPKGRYHQTP